MFFALMPTEAGGAITDAVNCGVAQLHKLLGGRCRSLSSAHDHGLKILLRPLRLGSSLAPRRHIVATVLKMSWHVLGHLNERAPRKHHHALVSLGSLVPADPGLIIVETRLNGVEIRTIRNIPHYIDADLHEELLQKRAMVDTGVVGDHQEAGA